MTEYGVTNDGYVERYYSDVVKDKRERAQETFGTSVDLTNNSVLGQFINSTSYEEGLIHQILENIYYSRFVQYATGKALDDVVFEKGIIRGSGSYASGMIVIKRDSSYKRRIYLVAGTIVSDIDGLFPYALNEPVEFLADVEYPDGITTSVTSVNIGADYNVSSGRICKLANPQTGIASITNPYPTSGGSNRETDAELRIRAIAYDRHGIGTRDNIIAELLKIAGVKNVDIKEYFEKKTGVVLKTLEGITVTTILPCSFVVYIQGVTAGNKQKIIDTIENVRAYGIKAYCTEASTSYVNSTIKCRYEGQKEVLIDRIKQAMNYILDNAGFGGTVTYMSLVIAIATVEGVKELIDVQCKIKIGTKEYVLKEPTDYVDLSQHEGTLLTSGNIELIGVSF